MPPRSKRPAPARSPASDSPAPASKKPKKEQNEKQDTVGKQPNKSAGKGDYVHPSGYKIRDEIKGETPYRKLCKAIEEGRNEAQMDELEGKQGKPVVYWMRMKDLRTRDNAALSKASDLAKKSKSHVIAMHVLSPEDYKSHDRSARRIDFVLRNLKEFQKRLAELNIPLVVLEQKKRKEIPSFVVSKCQEWGAKALFMNMEHEVDELRRDLAVLQAAKETSSKDSEQLVVVIEHHLCIIEPGAVTTKEGKDYTVYSPWFKNWSAKLLAEPTKYLREAPEVQANDKSAKSDSTLKPLFSHPIPDSVPSYELTSEDSQRMQKFWPAGEEAASKVLENFLKQQPGSRPRGFLRPPADPPAGDKDATGKASGNPRIETYSDDRNRPDVDGTSRISPYLAAGVISPRVCIRALLPDGGASIDEKNGKAKLNTDRASGKGMWLQEVGWRDFYQHVLAAFPRVCMGHAFNKKYDDVVWEQGEGSKEYKAWCEGKTGFPIVDAGMRQVVEQGYMHNRVRMCVAMFLSKDLMIDWRYGEKFFMENLIDGDFASNNGGWQWSASTGTDPQPYFRVFNPTLQSEKSDKTGEYIKYFLPELSKLSGKALHDPYNNLSKSEFEKLGYPKPIVDHSISRKRAIARFKEPGTTADE